MKLTKHTKFWVVTMPTKNSTLADILFESDLTGLALQFCGGLVIADINAIYDNEITATRNAKHLLKNLTY